MPMGEIVARLRELLETATPGEWFAPDDSGICTKANIADGGNVVCLEPEHVMAASLARWPENRAFIIAAHNHLPALLAQSDALKAKDARIAELVSELDLQTEALDKATDTMTKLNRAWTAAESALSEARSEVEDDEEWAKFRLIVSDYRRARSALDTADGK